MIDQRQLTAAYYRALRWDEKATLLRAIIEAGDHPPGFSVRFDIDACTPAEQEYLRAIGIGPFPDGEDRTDAR